MKIVVDNVSFSYLSKIPALDHVSTVIQPGERIAVIGENGSGKSTFGKHLNGLLHPNMGDVWIGDWNTRKQTTTELAKRVAYVFQNPDEQIFCRTISEEVAFGPRNLGYHYAKVDDLVHKSLQKLGLLDRSEQNPLDLGYTGRKMIGFASAIAMDTPIIVFDELTANLDAGEINLLQEVLQGLREQGKTVILISHDMDFIAGNSDRVILLHQGRIISDSPIHQFFEHRKLISENGVIAPQIVRIGQGLNHHRVSLSTNELLEILNHAN